MATLTTFLKSAHGKGNPSRKPYLIENVIDLTESAIDCSSGDIMSTLLHLILMVQLTVFMHQQ